jgi:hypothetical protein
LQFFAVVFIVDKFSKKISPEKPATRPGLPKSAHENMKNKNCLGNPRPA